MDSPQTAGPWTLTEHLGSGGMGSVWLGTDDTGRVAAVKLIRSDLRHDPEAVRRFQREFDVARRVTTRRVAIPLDADLDRDPSYIAWEYIPGQTLQARIETSGPLAADGVVVFARDLAEALRDLEAAGITHRDVKPSNVLLNQTGAVLIDLGVALVEDQTGLTTGGQVIGTPGWLTPEQLEGQRPSAASDVFNWAGAVVFAATGRGPFGTDTLPKLMYRVAHEPPDLTGVPDSLTRAVAAALSKSPAERPAARRIASELNAMLDGGPADTMATDQDRTEHLAPGRPGTQPLTVAAVPAADIATAFTETAEAPKLRRWLIAIPAAAAVAAVAAFAVTRVPDAAPVAAEASAPENTSPAPVAPTPTLQTPEPTERASVPPPPDPDDPGSYYSDDGSSPALSPTCSGVVGICLGNPIDRAVGRLGTEDYRYDLEGEISYTWDLGAVTVNALADTVGSITELSVGTRDGARATTPIDGVVVGQTTVEQFVDAVGGVDFVDELSGEGFSIISLGIATGSEGHEARQVSLSLEWNERDYYELSESGFSVESVLQHLGHRAITDFRVGHEFPESYYEDLGASDTMNTEEFGDYGIPPAWVHEVLAEKRGGHQMVDGSTWDPGSDINVVTGSMLGGATGRGMYAFFFTRDDGYIGTDALDASNTVSIAWRDESTIAIEYVLYREGDPGCCATGGSAVVRFHWDGNKLTALDEVPPTSGPVHR